MILPQRIKIPKRYIIIFMVFIGYANMVYLHSNLGMAVVEMTTAKTIVLQNGTVHKNAEFNWTSQERSLILSSFSYGRLFSPIGGFLSGKFGGSTIYGIGILVTSLVTFFTPLFLQVDIKIFVVTNVILGAFETFLYASITQIFSRWAPPDERAKFVSFSFIGLNFGSGLSFVISGWILSSWNWQILFYASGITSFLWYLIWVLVVKNDPSDDKRISEEERTYIEEKVNCNYDNDKLVYPWKKILTCVPFWVACLVKFSMGCDHIFTFLFVPQYIKDTNNMDIKKIGLVSMIPQICAVISAPISGCLSDHLRSRKLLSVTNIHKIFIAIGTLSSAVSFICIVLWTNLIHKIIVITIIQFSSTFAFTAILVLFLDLAPKYASLLNSIANVFFTISGIVVPLLVGFVVTSHDVHQWNICFIVISCVCFCTGLLYFIFGSGKQRSWANYNPDPTRGRSNEK